QPAGTLTDADTGVVACAAGTLRLIEVQPPGKRPMTWADYANGRRVKAGERFNGAPDPSG
ncbi:MAG: hypothetical protein AAF297_09905, partial [Planctomycetota bacterium]